MNPLLSLGVKSMRYPIKYIENNLVFNHDGECFVYYELLPYNYSFLSPDEKIQVHDHFRQLIAQNQDGKIHALQISTASSIRSVQERSKERSEERRVGKESRNSRNTDYIKIKVCNTSYKKA